MKREFLKECGIEDKAIIDKILDENSKDIGRAKSEVDELETKVSDLTAKLTAKTQEYDALKESTKDYEATKGTVKQLELDKAQLTADNAQLKVDLDTKISEIQKEHERENKVRDAHAKNVKAVMALLDPSKDTDEQLTALKAGEDTAFLFGETHSGSPAGTQPNNPPSGGNGGNPPKTFVDAIAAKLNSNK